MINNRTARIQSRALVKVELAADHFHRLDQQVEQWNQQYQLGAPCRVSIDDSRVLEIFRPPPLEDAPIDRWAAMFGDGVHNLRTALDAFVFELCHLDGIGPSDPGKVQFPITSDHDGWTKSAPKLASMPAALLDRVRQLQPWVQTELSPHPLRLLTGMDNHDKHRMGIEVELAPARVADAPMFPLPPQVEESVWQDTWSVWTFDQPIAPAGEKVMLPIRVVPIAVVDGRIGLLHQVQFALHAQTAQMIHFIAAGEWLTQFDGQPVPTTVWSDEPTIAPGAGWPPAPDETRG